MTERTDVSAHYGRYGDLTQKILAAMKDLGKDPESLSQEDLVSLDQFHTRGHQGTEELAVLLDPKAGAAVLDVGCGIGGPARWLAATYRCRVIGVDLTPEYIATAQALSRAVALTQRTEFLCENALALPFGPRSFDAAFTQHAAMNIADKASLYGEVFRVLRPAGRFALYDVMAGPQAAPTFPVPWASEASQSHLRDPDEIKGIIGTAGFECLEWRDLTDSACAWAERVLAARAEAERSGAPLPPGPHLFLGDDFPLMIGNYYKALFEDGVRVVMALFEKPA